MDRYLCRLFQSGEGEIADRDGMRVEAMVLPFAIDRFQVPVERVGGGSAGKVPRNTRRRWICSNHRLFISAAHRPDLNVTPQCARGVGLKTEPSGWQAILVSYRGGCGLAGKQVAATTKSHSYARNFR